MLGANGRTKPGSTRRQDKSRRKRKICTDSTASDTSPEHWRCSFLMPVPDRLISFVVKARFGHAIQLWDFIFDALLISAFVERWRPESHTFHLP
ncbi:hypothetical protein PIB30_049692 [Stylosanthes scabra]|uniref:Aminotransferase-like plant mobile domain-containing protein n=1 Tax=Stylosanthes scabra TaxID=79078 RepID=A0ABU6YG85_9FABA|nr:hypothetical protein [Stylosanthes scabra]